MTDAFQLYALDHPRLARTLRGKLMKRREQLIHEMADGIAADYSDYRFRAGRIKGLQEAIRMCEETEKDEER